MAVITIAAAKIPNWKGAASPTLFISPTKAFVVDGEEVQGSTIGEKAAWFIEVPCAVTNEADARGETVRTLNVPALKLLSTTDSDDPTVKYAQKLAASKNATTRDAILELRQFRLPASPTSTTWADIRTYNLAAQTLTPADNLATYVDGAVASALAAFRALFSGVRTVTESETLADDEFAVAADSEADIILALPPTVDRELPYYLKNIGVGLVTLDPDGIETINREASLVIASGDAYIVVPAAGGWETF